MVTPLKMSGSKADQKMNTNLKSQTLTSTYRDLTRQSQYSMICAKMHNGRQKLKLSTNRLLTLKKLGTGITIPKKDKDLPRVEVTNKGRIIIELFEDDAPNGVANFISLVEKKYYDGQKFHRGFQILWLKWGC